MSELQTQELPVATNVDRPMSVTELLAHSMTIHEILTRVMVKDVHYGVIPGTEKPTLYQAGAEKICATFRLAPRYEVDDLSEPHNNFYRYRVKCTLHTIRDGFFVGSAIGESSSAEEKYQWEKAVCQKQWDLADPSRRRIKFKRSNNQDGFEEILQVQRNCADLANTVLKIAVKRSFTSATKGATAASDLLEVDLDEEPVADLHREEQKEQPKPRAKEKPAQKLPFGRSKGKAINDQDVPLEDLQYMKDSVEKSIGDPKRKAYESSNRELLAAISAELKRRSTSSQEMTNEEWADYCALVLSTQEEAYAQACIDFKVQDPTELPAPLRTRFQQRIKELTAK